jgi:hypothetical protein
VGKGRDEGCKVGGRGYGGGVYPLPRLQGIQCGRASALLSVCLFEFWFVIGSDLFQYLKLVPIRGLGARC